MSKNIFFNFEIENISFNYHVFREKTVEKEIKLEYVNKKQKIVDIFTNPLPKDILNYL